MSLKLSKLDIIQLMIQLEHAKIIKFETNDLNELIITPIGFDKKSWYWLLTKWGIDEHEEDIMTEISNMVFGKIKDGL